MFDYDQAFIRNLGWVSAAEQQRLRHCRVAIAGLGGVGGSHLLTLARLGVGRFSLAEFDSFDIANFNRQAGAGMSSLGCPKLAVMESMARDIQPELEIRRFDQGISIDNLEDFLDGVDLYVDSLDFFAFDARRAVFAACAQKGIAAITAAPLGMGVAFLAFMPGGPSFDDYFQLQGQPELEQGLRFLLGLAPARLHRRYLVDPTRVRLDLRQGPSTAMACMLCAGVAGTQALKILLERGGVPAVPWGLHFDAYEGKLARTWLPQGNRNPIQRIRLALARRMLARTLGQEAES
ncbi:MAG: ThiF family adenylyltransferase [Burkholderiales bacterium]|nr:ThiF family adenylyltransferase [Burkholderiales bacterium]